MHWVNDNNPEHKGWAAPVVPDGRIGVGPVGGPAGGVMVVDADTLATTMAADIQTADLDPPVVDGRTAIGWRAVCECGWRGEQWQRVNTREQGHAGPRRVYAPDTDRYGTAPAWLSETLRNEWQAHLQPAALRVIKEIASAVAAAQTRLDTAVAAARADGHSWAAIGTAAGITRQSAHERWANPVTAYEESWKSAEDSIRTAH